MRPIITPPCCLRVFPGCGAKKGTQAEPHRVTTLSLRDRAEHPVRPK